MGTEPVVALLARQSAARLREMQNEIEEQVKSLQAQGDLVRRALAEKGQSSIGAASMRKTEQRPSSGKGNSRSTVIEILSDPEHGLWRPAEIRDQLAARGVNSSTAAIRVMLRRMADSGLVVRDPDGSGWKLASTNGSIQETLAEAPSSGSGGV